MKKATTANTTFEVGLAVRKIHTVQLTDPDQFATSYTVHQDVIRYGKRTDDLAGLFKHLLSIHNDQKT